MFKKWLIFGVLAAILATGLILAGCQNGAANLATNQQTGISVSGMGKVSVTPDIATLQLGVTAQAPTVAAAQAQATDAMNKIMSALAANNIAAKDIQTSFYSIQEITTYNQVTQKSETTGFQVSNNVTVTIRQIGNTGTVIDTVAATGGDLTRINDISFSIDDPTASYDAARALAVTQAMNTASSLATKTGVKLGNLIYITESTSNVQPPIYYAKSSADVATGTPISPGEIDVTVNVQAIYSIK